MKNNKTLWIIIGIIVVAVLVMQIGKKEATGSANGPADCSFITNVDPYTQRYTSYGNAGAWVSINIQGDSNKEKFGYYSGVTAMSPKKCACGGSCGTGKSYQLLIENYNSYGDDIYKYINDGEEFVAVCIESGTGYKLFKQDYSSASNAVTTCGGVGEPDVVCSSNSQCGTDRFIRTPSCSGDNLVQDWLYYICLNPGTTSSSCTTGTTIGKLVASCDNGCSGGECIDCITLWQCGSWSACVSGIQTKTCTDLNNCGTTDGKPLTSQSCDIFDVACSTDSQCGTNLPIGNVSCYQNKVVKDYIQFTCFEPGTINSFCDEERLEGGYTVKTCLTDETCTNGVCVKNSCVSTAWDPLESTVCLGETILQEGDCGDTREAEGTLMCDEDCDVSSWDPSTSEKDCGVEFTQTSNCGTTRTKTGTNDCEGTTTNATVCQFYQTESKTTGECKTASWIWIVGAAFFLLVMVKAIS